MAGATGGDFAPLAPESDDLFPIPTAHRQGLAAVSVLAGLSFVSSTAVLLYLTAKLIRWHIKTWRINRENKNGAGAGVDLSLGLDERHFRRGQDADDINSLGPETRRRRKRAHPNQFLILIYNLLLADIHQAGAFLLNVVWVGKNEITVRTPACWAQGWLVSTGDLSSSCFITAIAVHTYLAVVWKYTPPQWAVYTTVVGLWAFNYLMAILGVAMTSNGKDVGGFYVRAAAWCWMNIKYETYRLVLHYLWIFISLALTSILYTLIFVSIRRGNSSAAKRAAAVASDGNKSDSPATTEAAEHSSSAGHYKAFFLYPVIYVVCTAPLALGRIATMAGVDVPIAYFCTAGALITSNGWLDVLLWGVTRHRLLFSADVDTEESGLDTFTFMRTPPERRYGNMVWVEGASGNGARNNNNDHHQRALSLSKNIALGNGTRSAGGGSSIDGLAIVGGRLSTSTSTLRRGGENVSSGGAPETPVTPVHEGENDKDIERFGGIYKRQTGWRRIGRLQKGGSFEERKKRTASQESLRRMAGQGGGEMGGVGGSGGAIAIQMDMVTSVVVEERSCCSRVMMRPSYDRGQRHQHRRTRTPVLKHAYSADDVGGESDKELG